ncbi:energy transducer TonB [Almyronema epifaneia]|uniref:Energy transducer TonB n=1 Tax=Almyronema epifaneia S1 TaxID=2991925 RepID=A0ABW6IH06_9CYAN
MGLSQACLEQHDKENALTRRCLSWGLLSAVGVHAGFVPMLLLMPTPLAATKTPNRIELVVTPPEPDPAVVEPETELAEEVSAAAPSQPAASQPAAAPALQPVAALPPPAAPLPAQPESAPEIVEADEDQPDLEDEAVLPETSEETEDAVETEPDGRLAKTEISESEAEPETNIDDIRSSLSRLFSQDEITRDSADSGTDAAIAADTAASGGETAGTAETDSDGRETARATGSRSGSNDAEASGSDGRGRRGAARTVSCRRCDRPDYPESALNDGVEGNPQIEARYDANGNVVSVTLVRSSGNAELDRAALEAAQGYEFDTGGQQGSIPIEIDFAVEGSRRYRETQRRGERRSVEVASPEPPAASSSPAPTARNRPAEEAETDASESQPSTPAEPDIESQAGTQPASASETESSAVTNTAEDAIAPTSGSSAADAAEPTTAESSPPPAPPANEPASPPPANSAPEPPPPAAPPPISEPAPPPAAPPSPPPAAGEATAE